MKKVLVLFFGLIPATNSIAQPQVGVPFVAQQPAPVRLTFGMISQNEVFVRSVFSSAVEGSVLDATRGEPRTETQQGPEAVAKLVSRLPLLTGPIRNGKCAPGEAGKFACQFEVKRKDRELQAFIDVEGNLITSVIFTVLKSDGNG